MLVFLIGFMGSGKTTIAKKLAKKLNFDWLDLDVEIENQQKKSVEDIFETNGEFYFREIEHQTLSNLMYRSNLVIACGGGTPCYYDGMNLMNQAGLTVYLQMPAEALYSRLSQAKSNRPLLKNRIGDELLNFIKANIIEREPTYLKAKIIINGLNINLPELEKRILLEI